MPDGFEVVVKEREPAERVLACLDLQSFLNRRGFPCPQPLAGPTLINGRLLTADRPGGLQSSDAVRTTSPKLPSSVAAVVRLRSAARTGSRPSGAGSSKVWVASSAKRMR